MAAIAQGPAAAGAPALTTAELEARVKATAARLFAAIGRHRTSPFSAERWQGEMMDWATADERLKVELFRFIDVFPTLRTAADIDRHLDEYLGRPDLATPRPLRLALGASRQRLVSPLAASVVRRQMVSFAERFIVGRDAAAALPKLRALRRTGTGFTLDVLGEASVGEAEVADYQRRYIDLLEGLHREAGRWAPVPAIDRAAWGPLPRVNVSIKITSLHSQIDPVDFRGSVEAVKARLRPIVRKAQSTGAFVNLDLEQFRYRDITFAVFRELLDESEFASYDDAGVVVQAYLRDAEDDVRALIDWARERRRVVTVRLVKGAYWDYETVQAAQEGWPEPVFMHKPDSDVQYERITRIMLEHPDEVRSAFASHNVRSLANAIATAEALGLSRDAYEIQMLHGMGAPIKAAVRSLGLRLREYAPVGELIPGMAYFVRRLLENTANESFLRLTFAEGAEVDRLVAAPEASPDAERVPQRLPRSAPTAVTCPGTFANQPHADFTRPEARDAFAAALTRVRSGEAAASLGAHWPLWIDGVPLETAGALSSVDPAVPARVVGTAAYAGEVEAELAVAAARRAFDSWSAAPARERAAVLFRTAELMRRELFDLAALEVFEAGKTWREADADVGEAIDFLEYYGREMLRLDGPGAGTRLCPLGVALVIAPWNFPLAILTGMTSAALVAGNCVIVKPAGTTPVVAAQLVRLLHAAGAPPGTVNYLPSPGATVGDALVRHPQVDMIAFTGSRDVGLRIVREAAAHPAHSGPKTVVAEMGGKNAIIVDADADLDVAVLESVISAFHYQGQKCSAASRVIVLASAYDEFVRRFVDASRSVVVGPPEEPGSRMGPVISAEAKSTIERYIELGKREGRQALVTEPPAGGWPGGGFYVGPHIFTDVAPDAVIAQEEIFGPVVAVMKARDMDEALAMANDTPYALTGGLISRSPATIARVRREFRVGNLYINRGTTGALVERQAFGGFKMSGVGSKAGGPDYLPQFMRRRTSELPAADVAEPAAAVRSSRASVAGGAKADAGQTESQAAAAAVCRAAASSGAVERLSVAARARALRTAAEAVRANGRELRARLIAEAGGDAHAVSFAAREVEDAAGHLERAAALLPCVDTVRRMGRRPGELNLYFYQPRGLVLALASSRWPLTSACRMLGAALAAGCPAVLKPGRLAHESSLHLWRCLARAGFPAGAVGFAPVQSDVCGDELVARPDVGIVALTGSGEAAARVVANAGRQPAGDSVKRVLAERLEAAPGPPDELYLVAFLEPRVITENTLRRGFAPSDDLLDTAR